MTLFLRPPARVLRYRTLYSLKIHNFSHKPIEKSRQTIIIAPPQDGAARRITQ